MAGVGLIASTQAIILHLVWLISSISFWTNAVLYILPKGKVYLSQVWGFWSQETGPILPIHLWLNQVLAEHLTPKPKESDSLRLFFLGACEEPPEYRGNSRYQPSRANKNLCFGCPRYVKWLNIEYTDWMCAMCPNRYTHWNLEDTTFKDKHLNCETLENLFFLVSLYFL